MPFRFFCFVTVIVGMSDHHMKREVKLETKAVIMEAHTILAKVGYWSRILFVRFGVGYCLYPKI